MPKQLPARPNLDQLKRQAKDLLKHQRATGVHPDAALHDAQTAVARDYGFASWNALRQRVEELTLDFETALREFILASTDGRGDRAERLLAQHPRIAGDPYAALLLGAPGAATTAGGVRDWEPLHYLCHSAVGARTPEREAGLAGCARQLVATGADPNLRFPWQHHNVRRPILWGALSVTRSLVLARALLELGANPSDGISLVIAATRSNLPALDLLHEFGADVNFPWATDGASPLYAILQWTQDLGGVYWLLDHGADPDPVFAPNGETPLHAAVTVWGVDLVEALVERGADIHRHRRDGRTPLAIAEINGNHAVAEWLRARGAQAQLSELDVLVAAASRGDLAGVQAVLARSPGIGASLGAAHYPFFFRAADFNRTAVLEAMLAAGFDPNRGDEEIGMTALHHAAMAGCPEAVCILLAHGASVTARDREFHSTPLMAAAEGARRPETETHSGHDFDEVGRILLEAGSPIDWDPGDEPDGEHMAIVNRWRGIPDA